MRFSKESIITRKLAAINQLIHQDELPIPQWQTRHATFMGGGEYTLPKADMDVVELNGCVYTGMQQDAPVSVGDRWECRDDFTRWFSAEVTVPESFAGKPLALNLEFGGEGIVRVNGEIISAITSYLEPRGATRTRVLLADEAVAGTVYQVEIESHMNYMEFSRFRRQGSESIQYTIRAASLVTINPVAESYYYDLQTALDGMQMLKNPLEKVTKSNAVLPGDMLKLIESFSKDSYYYDKVTAAVVASLTCVDFDFDNEAVMQSIPKAAQILRKKLKEISSNTHGVIKFVGQAHIDTAWLWPVRESIRKSAKTLSNVCSLMDKYPEFTFAFSQPQLFEMVKTSYPKLYERVKEKVRSGQFELVGNTWVEMDTNIPSGESLVRQIMYGRQYFLEEFGRCSNVFWMPDVFGYSWALPQIIQRSGMKYFFTSKLINNDDNRFPYSLFQWQGVDGTKIPAYLQRMSYNSDINPATMNTLYQRYDQKAVLDEAMLTFGYGDGGGGPSYQMLETARRLEHFPGLPKLEMATSQSYFEDVEDVRQELPVWNDEMYYEFHRGTYTSQANTKKNNRKSELLYRQTEIANVFSFAEANTSYPYEKLLKGYKKLLTNQFHDIMPGSSVHSVYLDAKRDYSEICTIGNELLSSATAALCGKIGHGENTVVVFNFLSWSRTEPVTVDLTETAFADAQSVAVYSADGCSVKSVLTQKDGRKLLEFTASDIPSMGYACYRLLVEKTTAPTGVVHVSTTRMENDFYTVTLDENANITGILDKRSNRQVLTGASNLLKVFEDKPGGETAWNIDVEYQNKEWVLDKVVSVEVVEVSAIKGVLRVVRSFNKSTFSQDIVLYADIDRIDFLNSVDWYETEKMLKAEFNTDILSSRATYEIQFGAIERPTHYNTSYDKTKFEVSAHKWADLSEGDYGVSLLNDCKYGYDIKDNRMRLTLLRAPIDPDPTADKGHHEFVYSLRPHAGGWVAAGTVQAGYNLNVPLYTIFCTEATNGSLPQSNSYLCCNRANVVIDTVKRAEVEDGIILRVYEATGSKSEVRLDCALPFSEVIECNLVEEEEGRLDCTNGSFSFTIKPFQIKTFKLR